MINILVIAVLSRQSGNKWCLAMIITRAVSLEHKEQHSSTMEKPGDADALFENLFWST